MRLKEDTRLVFKCMKRTVLSKVKFWSLTYGLLFNWLNCPLQRHFSVEILCIGKTSPTPLFQESICACMCVCVCGQSLEAVLEINKKAQYRDI